MARKAYLWGMLAVALVFVSCGGGDGDPELTGTVSITGTAQVGQTLTANTGSLGGTGDISYQWKQGTTNIGTNSSTYELQAADEGSTITVTVTRAGYTGSVTSAATAAVAPNTLPALTGSVTITGTAMVGQTLTANTDSLEGTGDISYQWKRGDSEAEDGTNIDDAVENTYELVTEDEGKYITVTVTRTGNSESVTSEATGAVINLIWTQSTNAITVNINGIAYNGTDRWVVVGNSGILASSSNNGQTWTRKDLSEFGDLMGGTTIFFSNGVNQNINAVAYGNGKWIAVGGNGKAASSTDGTTWTEITGNPFGTQTVYAVIYAEGLWVAGGMNGTLKKSTDGVTWTTMTNTPFGTNTIRSIAYGDSRWVAAGANGSMYTSTDGSFWTTVNVTDIFTYTFAGTSTVQTIQTVAYANNLWIAAASAGGLMATSTNGTTWTAVPGSPFGSSTITSVAYGNNKWLAAVGGATSRIGISFDGRNWILIPNTIFGSDSINGIAFGNGRWVMVGAGAKIAYADDN